MELRPYQVEAKKRIFEEWEEYQRTLLVLPTGCGKTVVFASVAKDRTKVGKVLILAHREELLLQASDKIKQLCGLDCSIEKADRSCLGSDELITVGSVQTLMSEKRLSKFPPEYFDTIIVDEAHHAIAQSYQNVLTHFDRAKVLGVTATPDRGDMKSLNKYFESLAYEYSLRDAVEQGYLSKIRVQTMPLSIDFTNVKVSCGDFQVNDIGHALEPYLEDIAEEMSKVCMNKHTVVFVTLFSKYQELRYIIKRKGFKAAEVNGESKDRETVLNDFSEGKYNVLCNSMLLTEGWDCPIVDCIVVLRPTKVRALYCQMVGRGTRLYPGKDHLLILDFLWMTGKHNLVHPADIICKKKEIADHMTKALESKEESEDLMELERDAVEERKNALREALKDATKERGQQRLIDPLKYVCYVDDQEIMDYEPIFSWEKKPATDKQKEYLQRNGINPEGMTRGKAHRIIKSISERKEKDLSTPKELTYLSSRGFQNVDKWTNEEAKAVITNISNHGWSPWRAGYNPKSYMPKSLRERNEWN